MDMIKKIWLACYVAFFTSPLYVNSQVNFTVKLVNSPGHTSKEVMVLNFQEVQAKVLNDSMAVYEYKPEVETNLFVLIDRETRWVNFAWINKDQDEVQLNVDFTAHKAWLSHPKPWDLVMDTYNLYSDNDQQNKADSVAFEYIKQNPSSYMSLWLLSHGAAYNNRALKLKLFKLLNESLSGYADYKEVQADLFNRKIPKIGDEFKEFELKDFNGTSFNTKAINQKVIVLHMWSNNCGPCVKGMDDLVKFYSNYDTSKVEFLSIALDENLNKWKGSPTTNKIKWVNLWQEGGIYGDLCMNYNLQALPNFVIFDKEKKLHRIIEGEELESLKREISSLAQQ